MHRRDLLKAGAAVALGASSFPLGWAADLVKTPRKLFMFTRSQGYEHDVVRRKNGELSLAERVVTDLGKKHGFEVHCTKDGREILPETVAKYDAFLFETTGDLTKEGGDKNPPMPVEGKKALLKAVADGKGFVGCHCASDTFHSPGDKGGTLDGQPVDSYIAMLGGEFMGHGSQQNSFMRVADKSFPGAKGLDDFRLNEEWYALRNFPNDLHVVLVQDTEGMKEGMYHRPNYPATWARKHGKGRVFYTSMGHRDDVWQNPTFHAVLLGGLGWAFGDARADVTPNVEKVTPGAKELGKK